MRMGMPILLVEDDEVDVENIVRAFKKNKIANPLFITGNGEEALRFLLHEGEYRDAEKYPRPGVIILDLNMPVMNGIEFLKIVKAEGDFKTIPVVVLTTSQEENFRVDSFKLGVAGYVIKPLDFGNFVNAVNTIDLYWTLSETC
ncbi:MAG: response regulator [Candidatus Aminicenantes bacterium]|nr:response regulator [Candidatus Aminicenantes bacterium]